MSSVILETKRLILRTWKEEDAEPYYQMNQDPLVIEFLIKSLSMEEVKKFIADKNRCFFEQRYTFFAVEEKETGMLIGSIGLQKISNPPPSFPPIEIGWYLASQYWGKGYATEAAKAVLKYALGTLNIEEIFACAVVKNDRSRRVMEKIGMTRDFQGDFEHPKLPKEHPLSKHVLYRMKKSEKDSKIKYSVIE